MSNAAKNPSVHELIRERFSPRAFATDRSIAPEEVTTALGARVRLPL